MTSVDAWFYTPMGEYQQVLIVKVVDDLTREEKMYIGISNSDLHFGSNIESVMATGAKFNPEIFA